MTDLIKQSFDPRLAQEYLLESNQIHFSNIEENMYVAEFLGDFSIDTLTLGINKCIDATSEQSFFFIVPWFPSGKNLVSEVSRHFDNVVNKNGSICGYYDNDPRILKRLLAIREEHGGSASGEWVIGGCNSLFDVPKFKIWDVDSAIDQIKKIGCFIHLGEMKQSLLVTKVFSELDSIQFNTAEK